MNISTFNDTVPELDLDDIVYVSNQNDTLLSQTITGAFFIVIFIISVIGNSLLLRVLVSYEDLRNSTNVIVLNLACSDLLFSMILPFWATYYLHDWVFGDFWCKCLTAAYFTSMYSSVILLTVLTVDRFFTVVLQFWMENSVKKCRCSVGVCVAAWVISIPASLSDAVRVSAETEWDNYTTCEVSSEDTDDKLAYYLQTSLLFFLPLSIILFCYFAILKTIFKRKRGKKLRSVVVVLCIVAAFLICWGPYNVLLLVEASYGQDLNTQIATAYQVCQILAYSHCCMNPLLYMLSQKMRKHLMALLHFDKVFRKEGAAAMPTNHCNDTEPVLEMNTV